MAPKVFYRSRRIRQKNLILIGAYPKLYFSAYGERKGIHSCFLKIIVSEYAKSIVAQIQENTNKGKKMYMENKSILPYSTPIDILGPISATFQPVQKIRSWIFFPQKGGMVEKEGNPTDMHLAILNEKNALRDKNEPFATYFVQQNYIFEYLQRLSF
jgi:hypothetical protein